MLAIAGTALLTHAHAAAHRVGLIVEHSPSWPGGTILSRCVQFAQDAIGGLSLLELAGVNSGQPPQVYDWGGGALTVCQIAGEPGTVPSRCFGPISGPNWSDWSLASGHWSRRTTGVAGYTVHDGDVEGWTFTPGFGSPPPAVSVQQACGSATSPRSSVATPRPVTPSVAPESPTPAPTPTPPAATATIPLLSVPTISASPRVPTTAGAATIAPLAFLAGSLLVLGALTAWNVWRRGP